MTSVPLEAINQLQLEVTKKIHSLIKKYYQLIISETASDIRICGSESGDLSVHKMAVKSSWIMRTGSILNFYIIHDMLKCDNGDILKIIITTKQCCTFINDTETNA